jgi:hypothetical protein
VRVGDLVKPGWNHGLDGEAYRFAGIVLERHEATSLLNAHVTVVWNDGDVEAEWTEHLELISENR